MDWQSWPIFCEQRNRVNISLSTNPRVQRTNYVTINTHKYHWVWCSLQWLQTHAEIRSSLRTCIDAVYIFRVAIQCSNWEPLRPKVQKVVQIRFFSLSFFICGSQCARALIHCKSQYFFSTQISMFFSDSFILSLATPFSWIQFIRAFKTVKCFALLLWQTFIWLVGSTAIFFCVCRRVCRRCSHHHCHHDCRHRRCLPQCLNVKMLDADADTVNIIHKIIRTCCWIFMSELSSCH